jgi:peptide/nickel transport system substrate-binding protein
MAAKSLFIFKNGTRTFTRPIGTGPFKFKNWKRGERSLFVRNDDYRIHDGPYLDELEIISISDRNAVFNAFVGGQIDAMPDLDNKLVSTVRKNRALQARVVPGALWLPFTMFVDTPPFDDNRVRQAFRLMIDRKQMVNNVFLGEGTIGNDLFCPVSPDYARSIPQRQYDPERAQALLKSAGHEGLTVSLATSDAEVGMLESATLFAEQAKKAGVTIELDKVPADQFWTTRYLKAPFTQSAWAYRPLFNQMAQVLYSTSPYNETHWRRPDFDRLSRQALRTLDPKKRHELWVEAQRMLWNEGGYIIWGFFANIDGISRKVRGLGTSKARWLNFYEFNNVHLA